MLIFFKGAFRTSFEIIHRIVVIVVPMIWLVFLGVGIFSIALINGTVGIDMPTSFWAIVITSVIGSFVFLAISTILTILGQKKIT